MKISGTLRIDGQLYDLRLTPAGEDNTEPAPDAPMTEQALAFHQRAPVGASPQAPRGGPATPKTVMLVAYSPISGVSKTSGKPYSMHKFKGEDQKDYVTFREETARLIMPSVKKYPITLYVEPDKRGIGFSILSIANGQVV